MVRLTKTPGGVSKFRRSKYRRWRDKPKPPNPKGRWDRQFILKGVRP